MRVVPLLSRSTLLAVLVGFIGCESKPTAPAGSSTATTQKQSPEKMKRSMGQDDFTIKK